MATPRETLKYYFRKYALPTEQQFAELIDAFVHKDEDILTQGKIDGLITELAGKVSKETFESFKTEIQGAITSSGGDLTALTNRMTTAEGNISSLREDVDTNTDNISGLNQRVKTLEEKPEITVDSTLDGESTNPVENKAVTEALNQKADNSDVTALNERVSTLENAEPPTITGNYLKQIADLDNYEGSEGEIVQYIGATNEEYRRGFCYEKVKNNPTTHTEERTIITLPTKPTINGVQASTNILREVFLDDVDIDTDYSYYYVRPLAVGKHAVNRTACKEIGRIQEGYGYYDTDNKFISRYSDNPGKARFFEIDDTILVAMETVATNETLYLSYLSDDHTDLANSSTGYQLCLYNPTVSTETVEVEDTMVGSVTSWQVIPTSPCVN